MPRILLLILGLLMVSFSSSAAMSAADCDWLDVAELDRLFSEQAPWQVIVGGNVGSCKFLSRPGPPNIFGANQMLQGSAVEAVEMVRNLRVEMAKNYRVADFPAVGEQGFTYSPATGPEDTGSRSLFFVGHRGRVVVLASMSFQLPVSAHQRQSGGELVQAALDIADNEAALAAASDCSWFDDSSLEAILPAGGITQHVFGENSCMATDSTEAVLMVSATEVSPALQARRFGECTWTDQPTLGSGAVLAHGCSDGKPRATLRLRVGLKMLEYNLAPGHEPTAAQREALVAMAQAVGQRLGS